MCVRICVVWNALLESPSKIQAWLVSWSSNGNFLPYTMLEKKCVCACHSLLRWIYGTSNSCRGTHSFSPTLLFFLLFLFIVGNSLLFHYFHSFSFLSCESDRQTWWWTTVEWREILWSWLHVIPKGNSHSFFHSPAIPPSLFLFRLHSNTCTCLQKILFACCQIFTIFFQASPAVRSLSFLNGNGILEENTAKKFSFSFQTKFFAEVQ